MFFFRLYILKHKNPIQDGILADKDTKKILVADFYRIFALQFTHMKKLVAALIIIVFFFACKGDDNQNSNNNNPFLTIPIVSLNLNLNLPEYNPLKFPGNSVIITSQGIKGIVVYNINNELYTAFELSDPNHVPNSCSKMEIEGIIATCQCSDENKYDIVTGQHLDDQSLFPMQQYRAERTGDVVHVFN